jgi:hypothetical protein
MGKWSEAQKRYQASEKGQLSRKKYQSSPKAREAHKRYMLKRKARLAEAKQTEEIKPVENKVEAVKIKESPKSKKS